MFKKGMLKMDPKDLHFGFSGHLRTTPGFLGLVSEPGMASSQGHGLLRLLSLLLFHGGEEKP